MTNSPEKGDKFYEEMDTKDKGHHTIYTYTDYYLQPDGQVRIETRKGYEHATKGGSESIGEPELERVASQESLTQEVRQALKDFLSSSEEG